MPVADGHDKLTTALRGAGLRATAPRIAVLDLLCRAPMPLSHPDVVDALRSEAWDRATLYRNLADLVRVGLARRTDLGDRVWRFEATGSGDPHSHPHFVCRACGDVVCLDEADVTVHTGSKGPTALRRHEFEVQLRGDCDRCRREKP
jgi:Fur family ferric uptake transcriptional regulator